MFSVCPVAPREIISEFYFVKLIMKAENAALE